MINLRQERYEYLVEQLKKAEEWERERSQLWYEMHLDHWQVEGPQGKAPREVFGVDTSCYDS